MRRTASDLAASGRLRLAEGRTYSSAEAVGAHAAIEVRKPIGKVVQVP